MVARVYQKILPRLPQNQVKLQPQQKDQRGVHGQVEIANQSV